MWFCDRFLGVSGENAVFWIDFEKKWGAGQFTLVMYLWKGGAIRLILVIFYRLNTRAASGCVGTEHWNLSNVFFTVEVHKWIYVCFDGFSGLAESKLGISGEISIGRSLKLISSTVFFQ